MVATWKEKLQYRFDNAMAGGTVSLIALLFLAALVVIVLAGAVLAIATGGDIFAAIWDSLMHLIDQGTITGDEIDQGYLALMLIVTVCGLLLMSLLIGVVNQGLSTKMEALRKGRSRVLESGHTVVLGFNEAAFTILSELCEANANHGGGVVVVLDEGDSGEVEDAIHARIPDTARTRVIVRSGRMDNFADLHMCSVESARSVVVNSDDDPSTVKAILAVSQLLEAAHSDAYITAVIRDEASYRAAQVAGGARAQVLYLGGTLGRITAHACRQPGISAVFTEILAYGGDEIYVEDIPVTGRRMGELSTWFPKSVVMGLARGEQSLLNPPPDTVVEPGDRVIVLAEDDGVSIPREPPAIDESLFADGDTVAPAAQSMLVLGCNPLLADVLIEEDKYLAPGSTVTVAAAQDVLGTVDFAALRLENLAVDVRAADIWNPETLRALVAEPRQNVLVLTDSRDDDATADAQVLLILLLLHDIAEQTGATFTVTSETRSVESQELASVMKVTDFVVSNRLTALLMTQMSQTRELAAILDNLLSKTGSEFYTKPAARYVRLGVPMDFFTVAAAVARKGEVFVGHRRDAGAEPPKVRLNPLKSDVETFTAADAFIVVAES
ncbi:MAG: hypothetical protein LBR58_01500 [Propionibacteriaceae bacterium]|jgi:hypothetical protein|nr:hypothetical protein [Propionibacteriaceae bacterium]